jgi:predicted RNase H-like HicB family nuclease
LTGVPKTPKKRPSLFGDPVHWYTLSVKTFTTIVERDTETGLLVGYVPGFAGAHSQAATLDELHRNMREVIEMLLEDGLPELLLNDN